ncbi:MAG: DUF3795 domain-containing protein [Oscillospiraceae bacterium]|nr:DUF3795 domain-containing protein [Oscillospiraceae bacterium]
MQYKIRGYPLFSACGLNCGLCPRYYTVGSSRCPGCAGEGFSDVHCSCGMLSCCQRKGLEYCFECEAFPCKKYDGVDTSDSFITHLNQFHDMEKAKRIGMDAYATELNEKISLLEMLLEQYDDGRKKSFFCLAVNLLDIDEIKAVMEQAIDEIGPEATQKEKAATMARLFEAAAAKRDISLKLRK